MKLPQEDLPLSALGEYFKSKGKSAEERFREHKEKLNKQAREQIQKQGEQEAKKKAEREEKKRK